MSPDMLATAPAAPRAPRLYYGWVIVAAVLALLAVAYTAWYSYALFLVALVREFGWARADAAGAFSVYVLTHAACSPIAGRLADRFGPRPLVHGGALLTGLAFLGCSQLTALWQLYLCYGVLAAIGVTVMGWVPCITLVGRWFSRRVGLAVGIAGAGIGLGTFLAAPPLQYLIDAHSWRTAYVALAVVLVLVPQPLALLLRARPEDMGLARDGGPLLAPVSSRQGDGVGDRPAPGAPRAPAPSPQPPLADPRIVDAQWARQDWTVGRAI